MKPFKENEFIKELYDKSIMSVVLRIREESPEEAARTLKNYTTNLAEQIRYTLICQLRTTLGDIVIDEKEIEHAAAWAKGHLFNETTF